MSVRIVGSLTWWLTTLFCDHKNAVCCVHGDEINLHGGRRGHCLRCWRYLRPLPEVCTFTGRRHGA